MVVAAAVAFASAAVGGLELLLGDEWFVESIDPVVAATDEAEVGAVAEDGEHGGVVPGEGPCGLSGWGGCSSSSCW